MTRRAINIALAGCAALAVAMGIGRFAFTPILPMMQGEGALDVAQGGWPRKGVFAPFVALLRSPELLERLQRVGEYLRFGNSIPQRLNELAILITARHVNNQFEWALHHPPALKAPRHDGGGRSRAPRFRGGAAAHERGFHRDIRALISGNPASSISPRPRATS